MGVVRALAEFTVPVFIGTPAGIEMLLTRIYRFMSHFPSNVVGAIAFAFITALLIVFIIDACDREIIAWSVVADAGISGEMVCDLMIAAVERRFQTLKVSHRLKWLSDNGSAYIPLKWQLP